MTFHPQTDKKPWSFRSVSFDGTAISKFLLKWVRVRSDDPAAQSANRDGTDLEPWLLPP
jgi:hypothetical protein